MLLVRILPIYCFLDPAGGAAIPTPALRDQTNASSDRQPMAFLRLVTGVGGLYEVVILIASSGTLICPAMLILLVLMTRFWVLQVPSFPTSIRQ
jgi:hypothetical protein